MNNISQKRMCSIHSSNSSNRSGSGWEERPTEPLPFGSVVFYDSTILHRGLANQDGTTSDERVRNEKCIEDGNNAEGHETMDSHTRPMLYLNYRKQGTRGLGYESSPARTEMEKSLMRLYRGQWRASQLGLGML